MYEVGLLQGIFSEGRVSRLIRQSKKLFIDNPNILFAVSEKLGKEFEKGTIREIFFLNQVKKTEHVFWSNSADFLCKEFTIEVGGRSKSKKQISNIDKSFVIKDDILIASKKEIPLWIFGFLY